MSEKAIFCRSGKKQNDTWLKVTINPDKLRDHIQEYEGSRFIKLNINIKPEKDQYGKDVQITVDTWKPEKQELKPEPKDYPEENSPQSEVGDDLPF